MKVDYCAQCGGVTLIDYYRTPKAELMEAPQGSLPPLVFLLCPGHPTEKHDGKLDAYDAEKHATIELKLDHENWSPVLGSAIQIDGGYGDIESSLIYLDAKQALSLLAWLQQEECTLKQLAKEAEVERGD